MRTIAAEIRRAFYRTPPQHNDTLPACRAGRSDGRGVRHRASGAPGAGERTQSAWPTSMERTIPSGWRAADGCDGVADSAAPRVPRRASGDPDILMNSPPAARCTLSRRAHTPAIVDVARHHPSAAPNQRCARVQGRGQSEARRCVNGSPAPSRRCSRSPATTGR